MKIRHTSKAGEDDPLKKHERHYRQKLNSGISKTNI